uniref:Uncharacterized protein n=1 Tax=Anguilla anguilla TaxID=7936 RepID=A0A0E9TMR3_ANGAN
MYSVCVSTAQLVMSLSLLWVLLLHALCVFNKFESFSFVMYLLFLFSVAATLCLISNVRGCRFGLP